MKIRNIAFSGFMASILMAGAAYADTVIPQLAAKSYVDGAYDMAVAAGAAAATAAENSAKAAVTALENGTVAENTAAIEAINDTTTGILAQAKGYTNGQIGDLGDDTTVVGYITNAIAEVAGDGDETVAQVAGRVDDIEERLGDAEAADLQKLVDITATAAELNTLDGITATTTEINQLHESGVVKADLAKLAAVTADAAELNVLDGITATTTEINQLHESGVVKADLAKLHDVTATAAQLNYVDATSSIQTQLDGKQKDLGDCTDLCYVTADGTLASISSISEWGTAGKGANLPTEP